MCSPSLQDSLQRTPTPRMARVAITFLSFFSRSGVQALSVRSPVQNLGRNHNASPSTLDVLYFLLVVEGQGAQPEPQGLESSCDLINFPCANPTGLRP